MQLTSVIVGPVVTEKAEIGKATARTYTLHVRPEATKIDLKNALQKLYGVETASIRVMRVIAKSRAVGAGKVVTKRKRAKKMIVTLTPKSPTLDLTQVKTA